MFDNIFDNIKYIWTMNKERILLICCLGIVSLTSYIYVDNLKKNSYKYENEIKVESKVEDNKMSKMVSKIEEQNKLLIEYDLKIKELEEANALLKMKSVHKINMLEIENSNKQEKIDELETERDKQKLTIDMLNKSIEEQMKLSSSEAVMNLIDVNDPSRGYYTITQEEYTKPIGGINWSDVRQISGLNTNELMGIIGNNPLQKYAEHFKLAEKKYRVNSLLLIGIAKLESNDGTSNIFIQKNNMFGYGAYDSSPFESAVEFEKPEDGIYTLAKHLRENYLTDGGKYFNGYSVESLNIKYASDPKWASKIKSRITEAIKTYNNNI